MSRLARTSGATKKLRSFTHDHEANKAVCLGGPKRKSRLSRVWKNSAAGHSEEPQACVVRRERPGSEDPGYNTRFLAEFIPSEVEGLGMTEKKQFFSNPLKPVTELNFDPKGRLGLQ